jgi:hypothetical protein
MPSPPGRWIIAATAEAAVNSRAPTSCQALAMPNRKKPMGQEALVVDPADVVRRRIQLDRVGQLQTVQDEQDDEHAGVAARHPAVLPVQHDDQDGRVASPAAARIRPASPRRAPGSSATSAITKVLTSAENAAAALTWWSVWALSPVSFSGETETATNSSPMSAPRWWRSRRRSRGS